MNEINTFAESQIHDSHYLKNVTGMGDNCTVVANRDIHSSSSGIKLVSAGMSINSSLYDRLLQHRLSPPLDECLSAENEVTSTSLVESAVKLMQEDERLSLMQSAKSEGVSLPDILKQVPLNPAIAFKLTVMRETQSDLFQLSLYVALVSTYIGIQLKLNKNQLIQLATASLLHDIGILHIDPTLLQRGYRMTEPERRHLYVHSVTGWMILKAYPEYSSKVLDGVLQHHEHLDGSGYPRGLKGDEIGLFGQIVAVAEIIASRYGKKGMDDCGSRLEVILKLNLRRYGRNLVNHLKIFYQEEQAPPPCSELDKQQARDKMAKIIALFGAWDATRKKWPTGDPVCVFINERMLNLRMEIIDAGLNPITEDGSLYALQEDSQACYDAKVLLDETLWQLHSILQETRRRWPSIVAENQGGTQSTVRAWMRDAEALL